MVDLNKKALAAHAAGRHQTARKLLLDALAPAGAPASTNHDMTARTHVHLAVVTIVGLKQRDEGLSPLHPGPADPARHPPDPQAVDAGARGRARAGAQADPRPASGGAAGRRVGAASRPRPPDRGGVSPAAQRLARGSAAASEEPDLPVSIPQPLYCPVPIEGPPAREVNLRCLTQPEIRVSKVVAYYRPAARRDVHRLAHEPQQEGLVQRGGPGQPGHRPLAAVLLRGPRRRPTTSPSATARATRPTSSRSRRGRPRSASARWPPCRSGRRDERRRRAVAPRGARAARPPAASARALLGRRAPGSIWVGLGLGNGLGLARPAPARAPPPASGHHRHLAGRAGPRRARAGFAARRAAPRCRCRSATSTCRPAARATRRPPAPRPRPPTRSWPASSTRWSTWATSRCWAAPPLGGGSALRMKVEPDRELGLVTSDTVVVGPLVGGLGLGLAYNFNDRFMALAEGRAPRRPAGTSACWSRSTPVSRSPSELDRPHRARPARLLAPLQPDARLPRAAAPRGGAARRAAACTWPTGGCSTTPSRAGGASRWGTATPACARPSATSSTPSSTSSSPASPTRPWSPCASGCWRWPTALPAAACGARRGRRAGRRGHFGRVFLADNGSTGVEIALKMALQAQAQRGRRRRRAARAFAALRQRLPRRDGGRPVGRRSGPLRRPLPGADLPGAPAAAPALPRGPARPALDGPRAGVVAAGRRCSTGWPPRWPPSSTSRSCRRPAACAC